MENFRDLIGIIDVASITEVRNEFCAYGISRGREIRVAYANGHVGKECLVRFDHNKDDGLLTTRLINTRVPPNFTAKRQEEYVLVAFWNERMGRRPSSLDGVNRYFDPGKLGSVVFLGADYSKRRGLITISVKGSIPRPGKSINQIVGNLPDPKQSARLVITESVKYMDDVINAIEYKKLTPIALKAIR